LKEISDQLQALVALASKEVLTEDKFYSRSVGDEENKRTHPMGIKAHRLLISQFMI
jgi:hypothetical protein